MGLTLDELVLLKKLVEDYQSNSWHSQLDETSRALFLLDREIKLKTINPVTGNKIDINGKEMNED